jgi:hypothetical protein
LNYSAVVPGKLKGQIVHGGPKIVANFSDQDSKPLVYDDGLDVAYDRFASLRSVVFHDGGIVIELPEGCLLVLKVGDVFCCPLDPIERILERVDHTEDFPVSKNADQYSDKKQHAAAMRL